MRLPPKTKSTGQKLFFFLIGQTCFIYIFFLTDSPHWQFDQEWMLGQGKSSSVPWLIYYWQNYANYTWPSTTSNVSFNVLRGQIGLYSWISDMWFPTGLRCYLVKIWSYSASLRSGLAWKGNFRAVVVALYYNMPNMDISTRYVHCDLWLT